MSWHETPVWRKPRQRKDPTSFPGSLIFPPKPWERGCDRTLYQTGPTTLENGKGWKSNNSEQEINNTARAVQFFCIFRCRPYTSTTWKCPISLSMQPERVMFCAKIRPLLNLTNTVTNVQSTKLTLNLKQQEPINSEHFLSHSNHSHTDM